MVCPTLLPWGLRRDFGRRGRRGIVVGAQAESDQGEGVNLAGGIQILLRLKLLHGIGGGLIPRAGRVLGLQKALGCQGALNLAVAFRRRRHLAVAPGDATLAGSLLAARGSAPGGGARLAGGCRRALFLRRRLLGRCLLGRCRLLDRGGSAGAPGERDHGGHGGVTQDLPHGLIASLASWWEGAYSVGKPWDSHQIPAKCAGN